MCSDVHLQQKGRAPGNEGGAEGCAPSGSVVPAGIRGNDPFPGSRQFDDIVSEVGKRTASIQIAGGPYAQNVIKRRRRSEERRVGTVTSSRWTTLSTVRHDKV